MKETLEQLVREGLRHLSEELGQAPRDEKKGREEVVVEHPTDLANGDYTTNAALVTAKQFGKSPREVAELLAQYIDAHLPAQAGKPVIEKIEIAGPGFINFRLSKEFFKQHIGEIIEKGGEFGKTNIFNGEKVMVEHTDPNYFKELHIGHYMPMTIGSAIANLYRWNGADVKEACYYADVGLQAAKAVWAMKHGVAENPYVAGTKAYDTDENAKKEIIEINKKIYEHSDPEIEKLYKQGSEESVKGFENIYTRFGIAFDLVFYESEAAKIGAHVVREHMGEVFELSDGAVVFHAEKYDPSLHTRVFINSEGIPTYEAKDLGLAKLKFQKYQYTKSIIITGNEQKEYFRVLLAAMKFIYPDLRDMTKHLPHGMLRLPSGKMSSRTGDVITAVSLIEDVKQAIAERGNEATDEIAVGAIKYMILKQSIGGDIVFDFDKSISTEGDSGVYLQYAYARTRSLLDKAGKRGDASGERKETHEVERLLYRFPEVVERAGKEYAPHYITTYLIELAGAYNNFYAHEQVIPPPDWQAGSDDSEYPYRLAIVEAFETVLKNGLDILGIPAPERM